MTELFDGVLSQAKDENRAYLMEHECKAILEDLGISTTGALTARSEDEAVKMSESIG